MPGPSTRERARRRLRGGARTRRLTARDGGGTYAEPVLVLTRRIGESLVTWLWGGYAVGWPVAVGRLVALARRLHVDVVHSNSLHSWYGWAAARTLRTPHVVHAREIVKFASGVGTPP